ncbi:hypothetical protein ABZZ47_38890 [Streptomyces sp. NPDC006465]|uniref:hypothetical protein n=1 Tax=Streptomyces sp. NPDC006465 TaxID=3157174 RepID=UPI0033BD4936
MVDLDERGWGRQGPALRRGAHAEQRFGGRAKDSAPASAVIAAGEQRPDGSLRPALGDLLGAGALISDLHAQGAGP